MRLLRVRNVVLRSMSQACPHYIKSCPNPGPRTPMSPLHRTVASPQGPNPHLVPYQAAAASTTTLRYVHGVLVSPTMYFGLATGTDVPYMLSCAWPQIAAAFAGKGFGDRETQGYSPLPYLQDVLYAMKVRGTAGLQHASVLAGRTKARSPRCTPSESQEGNGCTSCPPPSHSSKLLPPDNRSMLPTNQLPQATVDSYVTVVVMEFADRVSGATDRMVLIVLAFAHADQVRHVA